MFNSPPCVFGLLNILSVITFQPMAVEVFSADGRNYLLAFQKGVRNKVYQRCWIQIETQNLNCMLQRCCCCSYIAVTDRIVKKKKKLVRKCFCPLFNPQKWQAMIHWTLRFNIIKYLVNLVVRIQGICWKEGFYKGYYCVILEYNPQCDHKPVKASCHHNISTLSS